MKWSKKVILPLSLLLILSFVTPVPYTHNYVAAATVRISKTKITMGVGETTTLNVSGTKKAVRWATGNKKVATVSSKGLVTAKSAGIVTITATVNGEKYTCKVTVKSVLTSEQATENIQYVTQETNDGLIVILQNDNTLDVATEVKVVYYGKNGDIVSTDNYHIKTMKSGGLAVVDFNYPRNKNNKKIKYDRFEIIPTVTMDSVPQLKSYVNEVSVSSTIGTDGIIAKVTNNSNVTLNEIDLIILYYSNNILVGYKKQNVNNLKSKKSKKVEFAIPLDNNNYDILYDNYNIIINEAYTLD
ncbi:hypothetical protein acsn021_22880 [Anaerocolumna cellulosilytica]|uniref:Uncharacterized protein n=1 Tax=Anaerocolumna cellulosilytica TaxID=433286 RepID=A0A6S6R089_9FIRM|nr:Ig-like domain-containing protein [Anaerocolumna cellulosilytica]MBB5194067.1 hypothetical protein [Anaerocolumna cellulosilytica]BCJ94719.1 hypothetical protein acsn021_22880 [Anaerocolumna cellulosilytica]